VTPGLRKYQCVTWASEITLRGSELSSYYRDPHKLPLNNLASSAEMSEPEPEQNCNQIKIGKNRNFLRFWLTRTEQTEKTDNG